MSGLPPAQTSAVFASLERVGELHGDIAPRVYARLFACWPELEPLFVMDRTGAVRGEMLALALRSLIQVAEGEGAGPALIRAEMVNHDAFEVPPAVFARFYAVVATTIAELLGAEWTGETALAWAALLAEVQGLAREQAARSGFSLHLADTPS